MRTLKKYGVNFVFGLLFLIVTTLYQSKLIDIKVFIGLLGSIATIYFGVLKLKIENDILFKELFKTFNERYDTKLNDLINTLKSDPKKDLISEERNLIIDYFNLCAEEFLWNTKNRIPNDVWKAWKAGILENLAIPQIRKIYESETLTERGKISYYGLHKELKRKKYWL